MGKRELKLWRASWDHAMRVDEAIELSIRAEELLFSYLTKEQEATFAEWGYIEVIGQSGRSYYLVVEDSDNVFYQHKGGGWVLACAAPQGLPVADILLGQMICLTVAEDQFHAVANRSGEAPPYWVRTVEPEKISVRDDFTRADPDTF